MYEWGIGRLYKGNDHFVKSYPNDGKRFEYLIFTDSKGCGSNGITGDEWTIRLSNYFIKKNISHLIICRPKEITVFPTLINFLQKNQIKFNKLITNLGFVDTTPKKSEFIDDIIDQTPAKFSRSLLSKVELCNYKLNSGDSVPLYSVDYGDMVGLFATEISQYFEKIFLIEVFEFDHNIKIKRERPPQFYTQLKDANNLIRNISSFNRKFELINMGGVKNYPQEEFSYDAVHFTKAGHDYVFSKLFERLEN